MNNQKRHTYPICAEDNAAAAEDATTFDIAAKTSDNPVEAEEDLRASEDAMARVKYLQYSHVEIASHVHKILDRHNNPG